MPLGDCVIADTSGEVPQDLYSNTGVVATSQYAPFTKSLTVRGIMLLARDEISSSFLEKVGATIEEMFPQEGDGIDSKKQEETIKAMY